jgi:hypothetical protein
MPSSHRVAKLVVSKMATTSLLVFTLPLSINAFAGQISQSVIFETSGQSMWGTGSSLVYSNLDNPLFLGTSWDESGQILKVGDPTEGGNGVKISGSTSGKVGLELGFEIDSGTVNSSLPFEFLLDIPDANDLMNGNVFSMGVTKATLLDNAFLETISPTIQAYADLIIKATASVTATGCYDVFFDSDCGTSSKKLIDVNENLELLSINRDNDGQVRVLDGFSPLFAAGATAADVVNVETDPDDPEGRKKKVSIDLKPKVSIGSSPLVEVDVRLPQIIEKDVNSSSLTITNGSRSNVLSTSGSDNFLDINLDVDQLGTNLKILPPLGGEAAVDFGVGNVSASFDLLDLTMTPSLALEQDFSLSISDMSVSYLFDSTVRAGVAGGSLSNVSSLNNLDINKQINILWNGADVGVTPVYDIAVQLTNKTGLRIDTSFSVDLLKGSVSAEVLGINVGSASFGPLFKIGVDGPSLSLPPLIDSSFALGGFGDESGGKLLFTTQAAEWRGGTGNWASGSNWSTGSAPIANDASLGQFSTANVTVTSVVGAANLFNHDRSTLNINSGGRLSLTGNEMLNNGVVNINNGQLRLNTMAVNGSGTINIQSGGVLRSESGTDTVNLYDQHIVASSGGGSINGINLYLRNGSDIKVNNGAGLGINNSLIALGSISTQAGLVYLSNSTLANTELSGNFEVSNNFLTRSTGLFSNETYNTVRWESGVDGVASFDGQMLVNNTNMDIKTLRMTSTNNAGAVLTNNGNIIIRGNDSNNAEMLFEDAYTLAGNGIIRLAGDQEFIGIDDAVMRGKGGGAGNSSGTNLVNGSQHSIVGYGSIEDFNGSLGLINNGTINADVSGRSLVLDSVKLTNNGLVMADGGTLKQSNGNVTNISGSGNKLTLTGGQWSVKSGGAIELTAGGSFSQFENRADLDFSGNGGGFSINGVQLDDYSFTNHASGNLNLIAKSFNTSTFNNYGNVNLFNGTLKGLDNKAGGIVSGYGRIEGKSLFDDDVINNGTIRADGGKLTLSTAGFDGQFINQGRVEVMGGAELFYENLSFVDFFGGFHTFGGDGGTWASFADHRNADIIFNDNGANLSASTIYIDALADTHLILSGEKARLLVEGSYLDLFTKKTIRKDLKTTLETIRSDATLELRNGQNFVASQALRNSGNIILDDASLETSRLTNTGTLRGNGNLNTVVTNSGMLIADDGVLNLNGNISNAGGTVKTDVNYGDVLQMNNISISGGNVAVMGEGQLQGSGSLNNVKLTNQGTVYINSQLNAQLATNSANSGTVSVDGGVLNLSGAAFNNANGLIEAINSGEIKLQGMTILEGNIQIIGNQSVLSGYGTLDNIALEVIDSVITANVAGQRLTIDPSTAALLLRATLRAENGGILLLTNGSFEGAGGTLIQAKAGSTVEIKNIEMRGGRFVTEGDGRIIDLGSSTFTDMTFAANTDVASGGEFNLHGTIVNTKMLRALSGGEIVLHDAIVTAETLQQVTNDDGSIGFTSLQTDGEIVIKDGGVLRGSGRLTNIALTNQGTIAADSSQALLFDLKGDVFVNVGKVDVTGSGGMQVLDNEMLNSGEVNVQTSLILANQYTQSAGSTNVDGEMKAQDMTINGGTLSGSGKIESDVTIAQNATLGSTGSLILLGDLDLYGGLDLQFSRSDNYNTLDLIGELTIGSDTQFNLMFADGFDFYDSLALNFLMAASFFNIDMLNVSQFNLTGVTAGWDWDFAWSDINNTLSVMFFDNTVSGPNGEVPAPNALLIFVFAGCLLLWRSKLGK